MYADTVPNCTTFHGDDMDDPEPKKRLTIAELEQLLNRETGWEDDEIEILPNGEIRTKGGSTVEERGEKKPLTMREQLGGEYGRFLPKARRWRIPTIHKPLSPIDLR